MRVRIANLKIVKVLKVLRGIVLRCGAGEARCRFGFVGFVSGVARKGVVLRCRGGEARCRVVVVPLPREYVVFHCVRLPREYVVLPLPREYVVVPLPMCGI